MIKRIRLIAGFITDIGLNWFVDRIWIEIKKHVGFFTVSNRRIIEKTKSLKYKNYSHRKFVLLPDDYDNDKSLEVLNKLNHGYIKIFSNHFECYSYKGKLINWHYQPVSGKMAPINIEWHKIPDFSYFGDIKLIWEASRFSYILHFVIVYHKTKDRKYATECIKLITDWINSNQFPYGVNYKCGQETTFRLFSWFIALDYFENFITEVEKEIIIRNIYTSLLRIDSNISYAVKSIRNNHSISEAAGLFIGGTLYPVFPESKKWQEKGLKLLVQETNYQIFDDGSYCQHSMNYHRLAMDVLSFVIHISQKTGVRLPDVLYERHRKMYKFLAAFIRPAGRVPNYGSNDGAYLFPLSEYQDFRPSINFASAVNSEELVFKDQTSIIDFFGVNADYKGRNIHQNRNFKNGGYFQLYNNRLYCFIRCHNYKTRPGHSDALHLDIWIDGKNILCDTGSYSYNTDQNIKMEFSGIFGHNTVVIDNADYMTPVFNFGKINWPKGKTIESDKFSFVGEHFGYQTTNGLTHRRQVVLREDSINVKDFLTGIKKQTQVDQRWHTEYPVKGLNNNHFQIENVQITSNVNGIIKTAKVARYYNSFIDSYVLSFNTLTKTDFIFETTFKII